MANGGGLWWLWQASKRSPKRALMGAVVVDQNMNGLRTFRNEAMEKLFNTIIAVMLIVVLGLFFFASRISAVPFFLCVRYKCPKHTPLFGACVVVTHTWTFVTLSILLQHLY